MQTVTRDRTKITDTPSAKGFDEYNLWDFWLLDEAEDVPCGSILTFLHYLCSEGTKDCEILDASTLATDFVDIRLSGPLADDERNHLLRYRLTRGNVRRLTAPCGDVAPPVIDGVWGCLIRRPPEEDRGHRQARLGLSKATWGNIIATRYQCKSFAGVWA